MINLIMALFTSFAMADEVKYKFQYGDRVIVHSSSWAKPCYDDEFVNLCGKVGVVARVRFGPQSYCGTGKTYLVVFKFEGLENHEVYFCEVHLKKVTK